MDDGTRTLSTRNEISGCYRGNHCELDGHVSSWVRLSLHSRKLEENGVATTFYSLSAFDPAASFLIANNVTTQLYSYSRGRNF